MSNQNTVTRSDELLYRLQAWNDVHAEKLVALESQLADTTKLWHQARSRILELDEQLAEVRKALAKKYDDDIGPWDIIHEIESAIDAAGALRAKPEANP